MRRPISLLIQPYDKHQASASTTPVFYFGTSGAGKSVTAQTTIWLSTEHTCVEAISEAVASLPLREDEAKDASTMNTPSITMTNPADSQNNHSACAGKRDWGFERPENDPVDHFQRRAGRQAPGVPQQAKCKRCYLCPACYYAPWLFSGEHGIVFLKKRNFIS